MEKIIIIGSTGTLGNAMVHALQDEYTVISTHRENMDITKKEMVWNFLKEARPNIVINASAYNDVDACEVDRRAYEHGLKVNAYGVRNMAESCSKLDIPLIHFSTDFVFSGEEESGYTEDDTPNPPNKYAETKRLGEIFLNQYTEAYYLIRISRLFGKRGESAQSKLSFVDLMLHYAWKEKKELRLVNNEVNSPTYAHDVACAVKKMLQEKLPYGIYHLANEGSCTAYTFANKIFSLTGISMKTIPINSTLFQQPAKRPQYSILLNTKLPKQRSWEDALADYIAPWISPLSPSIPMTVKR